MTTLAPRLWAVTLLRRTTRWIQGWHGAQIVTLWAACVVVPWQVGFWRQLLFSHRLAPFLNPGSTPGGSTWLAGLVASTVIPVLALLVTAIWIGGRGRSGPPRSR